MLIEDVKLMLVSFVIYLKIKVFWYSSFLFDRIILFDEYWRRNNVKNKIGFGIFKYFRWKKFGIVKILEELDCMRLVKIL